MLSLCWHVFVIPNKSRDALFPFQMVQSPGGGCGGGGGGGGGVFGLIFAGYVPLASQNPYPIIVYYVAILWTPLVTFGKK